MVRIPDTIPEPRLEQGAAQGRRRPRDAFRRAALAPMQRHRTQAVYRLCTPCAALVHAL